MTTATRLKPFREVLEDGTLRVNAHPGQIKALNCKAQFPVVSAGSQGGKTVTGPIWTHREMLQVGLGDGLAVTANYDLFKLKMLPELLDYYEGTLGIGRYWSEDRIIELASELKPGNFLAKRASDPMAGRIILRSADAKSGLEAATAKWCWLDEGGQGDVTKEAYEAIKRRVALNRGRIYHTSTLYVDNWYVHDVYQKAEKGQDGYELICFDSIENPAFPLESYEQARREMPAWKFEMFHRGRFKRAVGQIYDCFREETQLIKRFPIPTNWPVTVMHDFGLVNNAALFTAQNPGSGDYFHFAAYMPGEARGNAQHVEAWKELTKGLQVLRRIGGNHQEEEIRQGYGAQGWPISEPNVRDVKEGIMRVYALKKANRVYAFDDLIPYIEQNRRYSWKLDSQYRPTEEIEDKASFHLMDAERYGLGSTPREMLMAPLTTRLPLRYASI